MTSFCRTWVASEREYSPLASVSLWPAGRAPKPGLLNGASVALATGKETFSVSDPRLINSCSALSALC